MSNCGQQQHLLCWSASSNRPPLLSLVVNHFVDTMGGADFCQFSHYLAIWVTPIRSISGRSPRVRAITFISQPTHLLYGVRVALDFSLMRRVVRPNSALYEISVRQAGDLPPASFRFPVARDTLALGYTFPAAGQVRDFHPLVACSRRAHRNKKESAFTLSFFFIQGNYRLSRSKATTTRRFGSLPME